MLIDTSHPVAVAQRFTALLGSLCGPRGDAGPGSLLACLAGVPLTMPPAATVQAMRGCACRLAQVPASRFPEDVRLQLAAALLHADCRVEDFTGLLLASRGILRAEHEHLDPSAEALAVACLILRHGAGAVSATHIQRVAQLLRHMRSRHWWVSIPADLPTAAMLSALPSESGAIELHLESTYMSLLQHGVTHGAPLHVGSALLSASPDGAAHGHHSWSSIEQLFHGEEGTADASCLALLAQLAHRPELLLKRYRAIQAYLGLSLGLREQPLLGQIAAGLTFLDLAPLQEDCVSRPDGARRLRQLIDLLQCALCCWAAPAAALVRDSRS